jgi:hypothetical protein
MSTRSTPSFLSPSGYSGKKIFVLMCLVTASLIIDTSLTRISKLNIVQSSAPHESLPIFTVIGVGYVITQYLLMKFVKQKSKDIRSNRRLHTIVTALQYVLSVVVILVILQLWVLSYYNTVLLTVTIVISYTMAIIMIGLLAERFFSWFRSNRNIVVLSYGIASGIFVINAGITMVFLTNLLSVKPAEVYDFLSLGSTFISPGSIMDNLNNAFVISSILSFVSMWIATTLLLRHYSRNTGRTKYWVIIGIPLAYFLSQFLTIFLNLFTPIINVEPVSYGIVLTLAYTFSKPAGGILFGIAFWTIARNIPQSSVVRDYMLISAYGLVLLFVSNQAIVLAEVPYPPFGLATVSFIGLSAYLVLLGIYSSAISVSEDSKLRQSIRTFAIKESRLLDSIGMAQMEQQIHRKVIEFTKQNQDKMAEETGIQSSLTEEDMKQYLEQVIREVKMQKSTTGKTNNGNS